MSSNIFHAIVVKESLKDTEILNTLDIVGEQKGSWTLYKVEVLGDCLDDTIKRIQEAMNEGKWYLHFYNKEGSKLVIIYKEKAFYTNNSSENWKDAIVYGESLGIPKKQLDFVPNTFVKEEF